MPQVSTLERFHALKKRRDEVSRQLAMHNGRLEAARDHYAQIMRELASYGIGSVDELRSNIASLEKQILEQLDQVEALMQNMEAGLNALDDQEISAAKSG